MSFDCDNNDLGKDNIVSIYYFTPCGSASVNAVILIEESDTETPKTGSVDSHHTPTGEATSSSTTNKGQISQRQTTARTWAIIQFIIEVAKKRATVSFTSKFFLSSMLY